VWLGSFGTNVDFGGRCVDSTFLAMPGRPDASIGLPAGTRGVVAWTLKRGRRATDLISRKMTSNMACALTR